MIGKGMYNQVKLNFIFIMVITLCGISTSILIASRILSSRNSYPAVNNARIITKDALDKIDNNFGSRNFVFLDKYEFKIQILDLSGNLLYNSYDKSSGNIGVINNVGYDLGFSTQKHDIIKYSSPVIVKGTQTGTAIFYIKRDKLIKSDLARDIFFIFLPSLIALIIVSVRLIYNVHATKNEFVNPIAQLNNSADAIIRGDFDKKIKYNSETEIGKLCASFEMMRDELKNSIEREKRLENSRKELITCISHDLRTPIASIKAYADGIMDGIAKDQDTIFRYLSVISKKTQTLTKLINDLFDDCQIELNKLSIEKKEVYSGDFLRHISDELSLEFKNSTHKFKITDMPDVLINIDTLRIEQVIYNLIQNARKYTQDGGIITFSAEIEDDYLKISVKDNGYGVDQADLPFIFDKFYRGEKTRNSDKGGSGLGLSICKYIIESHGGQILVESSSSGSSFYFVIPKL